MSARFSPNLIPKQLALSHYCPIEESHPRVPASVPEFWAVPEECPIRFLSLRLASWHYQIHTKTLDIPLPFHSCPRLPAIVPPARFQKMECESSLILSPEVVCSGLVPTHFSSCSCPKQFHKAFSWVLEWVLILVGRTWRSAFFFPSVFSTVVWTTPSHSFPILS